MSASARATSAYLGPDSDASARRAYLHHAQIRYRANESESVKKIEQRGVKGKLHLNRLLEALKCWDPDDGVKISKYTRLKKQNCLRGSQDLQEAGTLSKQYHKKLMKHARPRDERVQRKPDLESSHTIDAASETITIQGVVPNLSQPAANKLPVNHHPLDEKPSTGPRQLGTSTPSYSRPQRFLCVPAQNLIHASSVNPKH